MSLPVPNLDDRRFQDLVDDAKRMIPSLTPEWTNHNVSDPGVALIELFAWMSEQVIYRLNQVPDRLYVDFLNLVGMEPFPAAAARVPITFWLSAAPDQPVRIPAGTEVTTADGTGVVFATREDLAIVQPRLLGALTSVTDTAFRDVLGELEYDRDTVVCFASEPTSPGDAFNLGFDVSLAGQLVDLSIETAARGVGVDPEQVPIVWEVWSGEYWLTAEVYADSTGGLNRSGTVRLIIPPAHEPLVLDGKRLFWLRVRLIEPREGQPTFRTSPQLSSVSAACLGGTVEAEHSRIVRDEVVGLSDGTPGQRFELANRPVLPRDPGEQVAVTTDGVTEQYEEVADFSHSAPGDRHVRFDDAAGVVLFGPRIRYPDGTTVQHGAVPAHGATIAVTRYRTGGGAVGNVPPRTLTALRAAVPFVDAVANLTHARGGVDPESVEEVKLRGPRSLRTGQRAVTPSDYEQLALEASPKVARARCVPAAAPADPVKVLLVPASDREPQAFTLDDFALTDEVYEVVAAHLDARRTVGATVAVTAPFYQGVSVVVRLRAVPGRSPVAVRERVSATLAGFLSPLTGGGRETGWPFDTPVTAPMLVSVLEELDGVAGVDELALFEYDLRNERRLGDAVDQITLEPGSLFLAGRNQVVVR